MNTDDFDFGLSDIKSSAERIKGDWAKRRELSSRVLSFGVRFLDLALSGILPNDLILIGAKTGIGKTELATQIAQANALQGKRVHYFALEAEPNEIERRIKFRLVTERFFKSKPTLSEVNAHNFPDWYLTRIDRTQEWEEWADEELARLYKTLFTIYRGTKFDADELARSFMAIQDQTDLVIIDHLHYIDSDDANENRGYKNIVKRVRDCALTTGKPVILIAHIRKGDRRHAQLVPSIEDFHGSSDIGKVATKALMIAPAFDQQRSDSHLLPTYIAPVKYRFGGSARTGFVALVNYDIKLNGYEEEFALGRLSSGADTFELVPGADWPHWARYPSVKQ